MLPLLLNRGKLLTNPKKLGLWGEKRAEKYLKSHNLKTLTKRFSCNAGELDLVMVDTTGQIVFVEVKTRAEENFQPAETAITETKKHRLRKAARYFIAKYKLQNRPCRFDVVTITLPTAGAENLTHYKNAFEL